jgi:hypothetical protein
MKGMRERVFSPALVEERRKSMRHALTVYDGTKAGVAVPGAEVRAFAFAEECALLPLICWDFMRLHGAIPDHSGVIVGTFDADSVTLARRIHAVLDALPVISGQFLRINRSG